MIEISKLITLGYRAIVHRDEIEALVTKLAPYWPMIEPIIVRARRDWPAIEPLAKTLGEAFLPNVPVYDVRWLQTSLNQAGVAVDVDGAMGPATHAAIRSYQARRGLTVDGWAGTITCATLDNDTRGLP